MQTFVARLIIVMRRTIWNLIKQSFLQTQVVNIMYKFRAERICL